MKSLNKVQLIGHTTADPELKYTPTGSAVCNFTIATNRNWTTETGEKKEEADFTRCVAWNKLAEICGKFVKKGKKVYVEGRLSTRSWQDKDGQTKYMTEVVLTDVILLDSQGGGTPLGESGTEEFNVPEPTEEPKKKVKSDKSEKTEQTASDDIPF
jgi:single-strand DNA-binding protein